MGDKEDSEENKEEACVEFKANIAEFTSVWNMT